MLRLNEIQFLDSTQKKNYIFNIQFDVQSTTDGYEFTDSS